MEFRIREILKEKGTTALALAGRIGMTQANLSNIMTGKTTPPLGTLEDIANALEVKIIDLFAREESDIKGYIEQGGEIKKISSISDLEEILERAKTK